MRKLQMNVFARCWIVLCVLLLAGVSTHVDAQIPGPHPEYLHAIRNLRQARELLHTNFGEPKHIAAASAALPEINAAISDLKSASHIDEKNLEAVPPFKSMPPEGRFHEVMSLLNSAHDDAKKPESDPVAKHFKDQALVHIDKARDAVTPVL
jgi:hypothetical protein